MMDISEARVASALRKMIDGGHALQRYGTAAPDDIAAYEARYETRLSNAYKSFLVRENGLRYGGYRSDPMKAAGVSLALLDMNTFFGIGSGDPDTDLMLLTPGMWFHHLKFMSFAPVIGLGGDFCTFVEISQGAHAGTIMYTDGELYRGFIPNEPIDHLSVDEAVGHFIELGWMSPVAPSFDRLLADYAKVSRGASA